MDFKNMKLKYNFFNQFLVWNTNEGYLRIKQEADLFIYSKCGSQTFPRQLRKGALKIVPSLPLCSLSMMPLIFTLPCVTLSLSKSQRLQGTVNMTHSSMATTSNLRKDSHAHLNILIKPNIVSKKVHPSQTIQIIF